MKFNYLAEALVSLRGSDPHAGGLRFLNDSGQEEEYIPYSELPELASSFAFSLQQSGLKKGDRVGLIIPEQKDFIIAFYSCIWLGLIPVPLAPPLQLNKINFYLQNLSKTARTAEISLFIVTKKLKPLLGCLLKAGVSKIADPSEFSLNSGKAEVVISEPDETVFLQFTSGSTSEPKGVVVSNKNILSNCHCIGVDGMKLNDKDSALSWLPFYHDMGLIGFLITPTIYRIPLVYLPPLAFIKRPVLWLKSLTRYQNTISFAPNFAYGLCTKRISEADEKEINLSSIRILGCGAEPIQSETVQAFIAKFSKCGFKSTAFLPCYGMAENTLAISFVALNSSLKVSSRYVSCGKAFPGHEITIHALDDSLCKDGEVGEIAIKGPSVCGGYFNNPEATSESIRNGRLYTGDLGFLKDSEVYICGRKKDLIIVSGKNYYPADLEAVVSELYGIRKGNVIAFGVENEGLDRIVITAERNILEPIEEELLQQKIKEEINSVFGLVIHEVKILSSGSLPKTSSGKLQRAKAKELYITGKLISKASHSQVSQVLSLSMTWMKSKFNYLRH